MEKFTSEELLKKELEICREALNNAFKLNANLQLENERLKLAQPEEVTKCCIDCINGIKSEARKEFAEKLQEEAFYLGAATGFYKVVTMDAISNLLKEMESE